MIELGKQENAKSLGKSLRLAEDSKDIANFAHRFSSKQLRAIEKAFDQFAVKDGGVAKIMCRDILESFLSMGRAITVSRLLEWMNDADVKPLDRLTLADFVAVFAYFFSSSVADNMDLQSNSATSELKTIAEIAVQVLQHEKWSGKSEQNAQLVARLCAGRSGTVVGFISKIRESFETFDASNSGLVSASSLSDIFRLSNLAFDGLGQMVKNFTFRLKQQSRETFSLPELFEFFGHNIQEYGEGTLSVSEAFAMLRMHCSASDIRLGTDMMLLIIDNILNHPTDSKFWTVNIRSEVGSLR
jgi:Ca2+-binding EF-hand superfamily protein